MARKFFNTRIKKKNRTSFTPIIIIVVCAVALLVLVMLILNASKDKIPKDAKVVIRKEVEVETGIFGAEMDVNIRNDGPVTIIIDSKVR